MSDVQLATRAVPQKLYSIGYSMAAVGLVAVLTWEALFPDRRDAMVLGGLPVRARTVAAAKLAALAAFVAGFAVVVNAPATVIFSFVAGGYLSFEAFLRYPAAHLGATVSAGLLVFLALVAVQAGLVLACPRRFQRGLSMLAQLLFVIVLIEWFVFAPGLLVRLAGIDQAVTNEALMAAGGAYRFIGLTTSEAGIWLPPVWFLGLYEVVWGFDPDVYRGLAATSLVALAAVLSIAVPAYGVGLRRTMRRALETPPGTPRRAGALSRAAASLARATLVRGPVEQAVAAFAVASAVRSRRHRLIVAAYVGLGLAFVIGSFLSPLTGIAEDALAEPPSAPSVRLLSIPFFLSFFLLAALRVMFTVPTEIRANLDLPHDRDRGPRRLPRRRPRRAVDARRRPGGARDDAALPRVVGARPSVRPRRVLDPHGRRARRAAAVPVSQGAVRVQLRARKGEREAAVAAVRPRVDGVRLLDRASGAVAPRPTALVGNRLRDAARVSRHRHCLAPSLPRLLTPAHLRGSRRPRGPGPGRDADLTQSAAHRQVARLGGEGALGFAGALHRPVPAARRPTPAEVDPTGEIYCFERTARSRDTGGAGRGRCLEGCGSFS